MDLYQWIMVGFAVIGLAGGISATMAALIDRWLASRFDALNKRIDEMSRMSREDAASWQRVERDLLVLRAELIERFVLRKDYDHFRDSLERKLDEREKKRETWQGEMNAKIETLIGRGNGQ